MAYERPYVLSGRNTIIHKERKLDLVIINENEQPKIRVTHAGLEPYKLPLPSNRREAKEQYVEVVNLQAPDVFGEAKTMLFIQALNGKEYQVDYSNIGTKLFVRVHQESYL